MECVEVPRSFKLLVTRWVMLINKGPYFKAKDRRRMCSVRDRVT